ncbi:MULTISPECIES: ABC transporter substrate-binding protein [Microbacterium]|uniref:Basic amino acid ABC transporter substrate-binding protein n=1 Tax=Microbacterium barkeri TaxID=33917 RepID=A0A9W6H0F8_9MICO|nr:ABC transporter substrate-binding protein [Microbacterium barkeri]MDR6875933.1 polar amino acid transport system substrate-binding protein [Microbacterium barkeri]GLJ60051.1 basic amino acid ABC transporter substrate-binding protein [Microbacterium barkeri]
MMQLRSRAITALLVTGTAGLALAGCASGAGEEPAEEGGVSLVEPGTFTVCSDIPYEPFEFIDDNGDTVGFDIDIANEIAADLDAELEVIVDSFESIQSGLSFDKCDAAISSISITEERKGNMDFSEPYMDDDLTLIASADSGITDLESAVGKQVGVQSGTTGEAYAQENGISPIGFENAGLQLEALKAGTVDAVLGNVSVLAYGVKDEEGFERVADFETGEKLGIAVEKGDTALLEVVNGTLQRLTESGELDELKATWFGEGS